MYPACDHKLAMPLGEDERTEAPAINPAIPPWYRSAGLIPMKQTPRKIRCTALIHGYRGGAALAVLNSVKPDGAEASTASSSNAVPGEPKKTEAT